ncbi:hypothetical protein PCANC_26676 [Puccinia coronata f. sp. avenae]|uniref:Scaffold protein Nfu/NifU N-terminal domain-containing protein n=1 Tax=Puccinia coronata f. sp. avenae TaxID=200324 RepID=A0A2N5TIS9_9BASI|nr:hypothetical protein PCANC_26676 [Puccinia coronata f. sp. avenae]
MSALKSYLHRCSNPMLNATASTLKKASHNTSRVLSHRSYHHHHHLPHGQPRIRNMNGNPSFFSLSRQPSISQHVRSIFIQTEPTPNTDALKFIPGCPVMKSGSREFLAGDDTRPSPLARSLLSVEGVKSVFFGPDFISINKESDAGWPTMKPEIYSLLMEFFSASDRPVVQDGPIEEDAGPLDTRINDDDSEVVAMIKELLDTRGSCRGCDSSAVTLKSGIERMLMHYVPEVQSVEQVQSEEEKMAEDEFAKFEARLRGGGKTVDI